MFFPYRNMPVGYVPPPSNSVEGEFFLVLFMILGFYIIHLAAMKSFKPRGRF